MIRVGKKSVKAISSIQRTHCRCRENAWPVHAANRRDERLCVVLQTDVGLVVRPKRYRAVLMDQDVLHRVTAPSAAAGGRPRYSLVWKLVSLARPM